MYHCRRKVKHQNEHIQAVAAGTVAGRTVAVAADTSYRQAEANAAAVESHMVAAGILDQDLAATHTGSAVVALATVVVGMVVEEMRQVEAAVEVPEGRESRSPAAAVRNSQIVDVRRTEVEELKVGRRQGRVHPGQLQQSARTCS